MRTDSGTRTGIVKEGFRDDADWDREGRTELHRPVGCRSKSAHWLGETPATRRSAENWCAEFDAQWGLRRQSEASDAQWGLRRQLLGHHGFMRRERR